MTHYDDAADALVGHFSHHAQRVIDMAIWPRREVWFNSEAFVAISSLNEDRFDPEWMLWGEQQYQTTTRELGLPDPSADDARKSPDIVAYHIENEQTSIRGVIEAKIVYAEDMGDGRAAASLKKLHEQMLRARRVFPAAFSMGVVYMVHRGPARPRTEIDKFFRSCGVLFEQETPGAANVGDLVRAPGDLQEVQTTTAYPSSTLSFAIASRVIA